MPNPFPPIKRELQHSGREDSNPAIQLFGRRFFGDQTAPELLIEFLLVSTSQKKIGDNIFIGDEYLFPDMGSLQYWPDQTPLEYSPKSRLNLKLFALLGASKLETRHRTHRDHYRYLLKCMKERIVTSGEGTTEETLKTLENLFLGFQRVGGQRTWCAQSFLPIQPELLAGETIWKEVKAKRDGVATWDEITERSGYFQSSQHIFLSRGGEVLYLQLCNMLRQSPETLKTWSREINASHNEREQNPEQLRQALSEGIKQALSACPSHVGLLAKFIDEDAEPETARRTDLREGSPRYTSCGWCPEETWREGLLFAVDTLRLCDAVLDPVERISLLETACAIQVLRTLCTQSARYVESNHATGAGPLQFVWAISDPDGNSDILKRISRRSVNANLHLIQRGIRHPEIVKNLLQQKQWCEARGTSWNDPYKEADGRYGHKLFLTLSKRLGLMVPRRGSGARFVLTDHLLRYLVLTTIRPGERMTYDSFIEQVFLRHGMALGGKFLCKACEWCGVHPPATLGSNTDKWLVDMLDAAGMLVRLSDSCSMVENPFRAGRENSR